MTPDRIHGAALLGLTCAQGLSPENAAAAWCFLSLPFTLESRQSQSRVGDLTLSSHAVILTLYPNHKGKERRKWRICQQFIDPFLAIRLYVRHFPIFSSLLRPSKKAIQNAKREHPSHL